MSTITHLAPTPLQKKDNPTRVEETHSYVYLSFQQYQSTHSSLFIKDALRKEITTK
ncbi:hypothetical protein CDL12_22549 [Handroanthus impetiginosus]|uniref:Uncharacterized protein n=1 Tax=Handroanthus impetiginosus TaxID=429701 RepID=A0A2G9GHZ1_9LAMI|nr:hypothetical protein CDL12_22549 [Handroanthus impetiginosus]